MKRLMFLSAGAAALMVSSTAFATGSPVSTNVTITGTVGSQCGVGNQSGGGTRSLGPAITLTDVVQADGQLDTTTTTPIGFDNVWCNAPNTTKMDVTELKLQNPPAGWDTSSFVAAVDMVVSGDGTHKILPTYFGVSTLQSSGSTDGVVSVSLPAFETGTLTYSEALVSLSMPSSAHSPGVRPLAGTYTGTVTVTATPN